MVQRMAHKRGVSLALVLLLLFTLTLPVIAAEYPNEPHDQNTGPQPRWTYFSHIGAGCTPDNSAKSITYSGTATGNNKATYKVSVYLLRADGTVAAGPYIYGPASYSATAGGTAYNLGAGGYYTKAYCYAYIGSTLVESTTITTSVHYIS